MTMHIMHITNKAGELLFSSHTYILVKMHPLAKVLRLKVCTLRCDGHTGVRMTETRFERQRKKRSHNMTEKRDTHTCRSLLWLTHSGLVAVLALAGLDTGEPWPGWLFCSSSSWGTEDPMASTSAKVWSDTYTKNAHTGSIPRKRAVIMKEQQKGHNDVSNLMCVYAHGNNLITALARIEVIIQLTQLRHLHVQITAC